MSACRSCGAPVVWVETEARADKPGRKMPLDANPDNPGSALRAKGGNIVYINARSADGTSLVRYVTNGLHVSHFATCPNAKEHRR